MPYDPATHKKSQVERVVADLVGRRSVWVVVMAIVIALPIAKALTAKLPDAPPRIRQLPNFTLLDQTGAPFGSEQLRGKLWVADFIFTNCAEICPRLTLTMEKVNHKTRNMRGVVHLVSFSVDPQRDTPAALEAYAARYHARGDWSFLTGPLDRIRSLVVDGFQLGLGGHAPSPDSSLVEDGKPHDPAAELLEVSHGQKFVLVDKDLWIRGFYDPETGMERLMLDMGLIANLEGYMPSPPQSRPAPTAPTTRPGR